MAMKVEKWRKISVSFTTTRNFIDRCFLHNGPDMVEELLERHIVKNPTKKEDDEDELTVRRRLTSTRREALNLYRDILRATRFFSWPDAYGIPWRDVLRENARREFEDARFETDPEIITRLLIGGHDAVQSALNKLVDKHKLMDQDGDKDGPRNR
ncbi:LYR family of Fe/S cluster biogenesis protein [Tasmannia lanceolata]|uniref:LYR family of Fe/S cluster biogenesis protein n=1 Tax=Tasmannia lanceolata TaxID=3420 RepID=UPI0040639810